MKENLIKRVDHIEDEGDDFVVGTIAGLEPINNQDKTTIRQIRHLNTTTKNQGDDVAMPTTTEKNKTTSENKNVTTSKPTEPVSPEQLKGTVMIKLRKQYQKLVDTIVKTNDKVIVQEFDSHFQINAPQLKITRQDGERALGKLNDGQWRILFMNREGELVDFSDNIFVLGVIESEVGETKELAQINTRIDSKAKLEMDEIREILGMTQAKFLEIAISEYVQKVRAEML